MPYSAPHNSRCTPHLAPEQEGEEEEEGLERKYNDIPPASEQGRKEYLPEDTNCERDRR